LPIKRWKYIHIPKKKVIATPILKDTNDLFSRPFPFSLIGCDFMRDFIWEDITMNAFSTFTDSLADVSTNSMPWEVAYSYPVGYR
jgi:hypothetical protein